MNRAATGFFCIALRAASVHVKEVRLAYFTSHYTTCRIQGCASSPLIVQLEEEEIYD